MGGRGVGDGAVASFDAQPRASQLAAISGANVNRDPIRRAGPSPNRQGPRRRRRSALEAELFGNGGRPCIAGSATMRNLLFDVLSNSRHNVAQVSRGEPLVPPEGRPWGGGVAAASVRVNLLMVSLEPMKS